MASRVDFVSSSSSVFAVLGVVSLIQYVVENEQFEDRNSASIANLEKGTSMLDRPIEFHGFGVEWWYGR